MRRSGSSLHSRLTEVELENFKNLEMQHDLSDTLFYLKEIKGYQLGIITNNQDKGVEVFLEKMSLTNAYFDLGVITRDTAYDPDSPEDVKQKIPAKPSPAPIQHMLKKAGLDQNPEAACIVGDSSDDIRSGQAAGITTFHIPPAPEALSEYERMPAGVKADFMISNLGALRRYL